MTEKQRLIINYAARLLENNPQANVGRPPYRNKAHHTRRMAAWAWRIGVPEGADMDIVLAACAFHDMGYVRGPRDHEAEGARMAREYLLANGYGGGFADEVCRIVAGHSDRGLLLPGTPVNTLVVIEADNLDEKGPMMILRDAMAEGALADQSYEKTYLRIVHHHQRGDNNICVTSSGRAIWDERQQAAKRFIAALGRDICPAGEESAVSTGADGAR